MGVFSDRIVNGPLSYSSVLFVPFGLGFGMGFVPHPVDDFP